MVFVSFHLVDDAEPQHEANLRVGLAEDKHGAVGEDLPWLVGLLLLQIFLLLTELEVVAVDVVHWRGRSHMVMRSVWKAHPLQSQRLFSQS